MWPGLFRPGLACCQSRGSSPQLKQDADYVTQGKPVSVATKARVGATGVLTLASRRISGRIYQAAQHYHVCGYFRPDDTVFFRISRHHVKERNLKR